MKTTMTFKLEYNLQKELEEVAKRLSISKSAFIRMAIMEKINRIQKGD